MQPQIRFEIAPAVLSLTTYLLQEFQVDSLNYLEPANFERNPN